MLAGLVISIAFGTVFVEANSGGLAGAWTPALRIGGAVVAAVLLAGTALVARVPAGDAVPGQRGFADRRYRIVVAIEAVALFGGLAVINGALGFRSVGVAWVALVVGVHFVALARAWHIGLFTVLGIAQIVLGVAGFVLGGVGASAAVGVVAGVCSGVALFATAGVATAQVRTPVATPATPGH